MIPSNVGTTPVIFLIKEENIMTIKDILISPGDILHGAFCILTIELYHEESEFLSPSHATLSTSSNDVGKVRKICVKTGDRLTYGKTLLLLERRQ